MKLRSLIVDDEKNSRDLLHSMLNEHCPEIEIVGEADNVSDAGELIGQYRPDLVFLDIQMPGGNGFDLLDDLKNKRHFHTVFVTAYNQYAVKAIKAGADDYILKPVDHEELQESVKRIYQRLMEEKANAGHEEIGADRLILPHSRGFKLILTSDIIRLEADNNYTEIFLNGGSRIIASKPIRDFENRLDRNIFFRAHKSHIINFAHFREYISEDGCGYALMSDGTRVSISRLKMNDFMEYTARFAREL
jgi:two-component system, LytTR family, response regulator